jgi:hypothetical protein
MAPPGDHQDSPARHGYPAAQGQGWPGQYLCSPQLRPRRCRTTAQSLRTRRLPASLPTSLAREEAAHRPGLRPRRQLRRVNFDEVRRYAAAGAGRCGRREPVADAQVRSRRNRNRVLPIPWAVVPIRRASLGRGRQTQASNREASRHHRPGNESIEPHGGFPSSSRCLVANT